MRKTDDGWYVPDMDSRKTLPRPRGLPRFLRLCAQKRVAIDVGANVGTWTLPLAKVFETVIAFEPASDSMECLKVNVAEAGLQNVLFHKVACGRRQDRGYIVQDDRPGRRENSGNRFIVAGRGGIRIVPITALGGCYRIDFIKIDVEGAEIEVLEGTRSTLQIWPHVLVVEVSSKIPVERFDRIDRDIDCFMKSVGYVEALRYKADRAYVPRKGKR